MKRSKAFLALMLSGTMTVTGISPVWGADVFSDGETEITDHTPETSEQELAEDELSMFSQETSQDNENDDYEFSDGEQTDELQEDVQFTDSEDDVLTEAEISVAGASEDQYQDGTYTPEEFSFKGGSGKTTITCPEVKVERGKIYATVVFSSSNYTKLVVGDNEYLPITGTSYEGSVFEVPAVLNQDMEITGTTTAMTMVHDITYTIHIKLTTIPVVTPAPDVLETGTYTANVRADSGLPVEACTLYVEDGQINAIMTLKNADYDRLYAGEALDAETAKEENMAAYIPSEDGTKHIFWSVPIAKLDSLFEIAARRSDDKVWTDHYAKIVASSVQKVSDEVQKPDEKAEALKYLYRNYVDAGITTTSGIEGKDDTYTVSYYDAKKYVVSSIKLNRPSIKEYKSGWFFSDWSAFKSTVKQEPAKNQTYYLDQTKRTEEQTFTATLKLYDPSVEDAAINDNTAEALAEHTYTFVVKPQTNSCQVVFQAVNSKNGEVIPDAAVTVTDSTKNEVTPSENGYTLIPGKKYTVTASRDGYIAAGTKGTAVLSQSFTAAFDETVNLSLTAEADSKHKITFSIADAEGNPVEGAAVTITGETPAEDGSYTLWDGVRYFYSAKAEDYRSVSGNFIPAQDENIAVTMTRLNHYQVTFKIRAKSGHQEPINPRMISVTYKKGGEILTVSPSEDGVYEMVENNNYTYTYTADNYVETTISKPWTASGSELNVELEAVLSNETVKALLEGDIKDAKALYDEITEGDAPGQWPTGTKETLNKAITDAETALTDENGTDDTYKAARTALSSVITQIYADENAETAEITVLVNKEPGEAPQKMTMKVTSEDAAGIEIIGTKKGNYDKGYETKKKVAVIDAMADIHKELFGEEYLSNPTGYLMCGLKGAGIGILLGQKSYKNMVAFRVNGKWVGNDPRMCALKEGDVLSVFSATSSENPVYLQFTDNSVSVEQNQDFTLTLTGDEYYMNTDVNKTQGCNEYSPAEGYEVTLVNTETEETVTASAKSDAEGKLTFNIPNTGNYVVKTVANENVPSMVLPYIEITVTPAPEPTETPTPEPTETPEPEPTQTPAPSITPSATPSPTPTAKPPKKVPAKKLTVNTSVIYLKAKKTATIGTIVSPSNTTDKVTYKSSKKSVATVSSSGKITAKKAGQAVITVKAGKLTKKITVNVKKDTIKAKSLKFARKSLTLKKGTVQFLGVSAEPKRATSARKWKSSNTKVVSVDQNGKITAKKAGTAKITVSVDGKKAVITIKVKK